MTNSEKPVLTDFQAMNLIHNLLNGKLWSVDTLDAIAATVRATGREITDMEEPAEEPGPTRLEE